jgi:benzylsuccinate CoA-transferase BbsF subunit
MNGGPLQGVRVTEFTAAWAGPYATCLLGLLGAEIVKVESRRRLDHSRSLSFTTGVQFTDPDQSSIFNSLNLNKKSVTLNISKPEAVDLAKKLIAISDVVIENMRPGVIERLGLGYDAVSECKPDIIYLSSSACGQVGPERKYVGYAPTFAALGGVSFLTGYEDWQPSNLMGSIDLRSAATSAFAILAALVYRQKTGKGQYIDLASQETIAVMMGDVMLDYIMNGRVQMRKGNRDGAMAPHNCYPCRGEDKWISIAVATDDEWCGLCKVMGKPELATDERFADSYRRFANQRELDRIVAAWTTEHDAYAVMELLQHEGVAAAPSMSSEDLFKDPHLQERGMFRIVEHPGVGKDWVITPPWRLSATPAEIHRHAPLLGEHNDLYFRQILGMSTEEIEVLVREEVIY